MYDEFDVNVNSKKIYLCLSNKNNKKKSNVNFKKENRKKIHPSCLKSYESLVICCFDSYVYCKNCYFHLPVVNDL